MFDDYLTAARDLAWPLVIALAWIIGEVAHRWSVPRISAYCLVGFACSSAQLGLLPPIGPGGAALLAKVGFGLILFEFGYRINLHWLRINPWLGASALLEAGLTFIAVYALSRVWGAPVLTSLLLASLSMATSPAALIRVINEQRSSGQVTERVLHLAAVDCVLAVFAFNVVVGFWTYDSSGELGKALASSAFVLAVSSGLGAAFGLGVAAVLRLTGRSLEDGTIAFAIAVVLLVVICQAMKVSPLVACLAFGLVARHRRVTLSQAQRNFGPLGELLAIVLFVYVAASVEWARVLNGLALGCALVAVRLVAKTIGVAALARASGITWRKGGLTALGLMPFSAFVVLLLDDTRSLGVDLIDSVAPLAAAVLLLEILGPLVTQQVLRRARETHEELPPPRQP